MPEAALDALTTAEFLAELRRREVLCWAEGDRLRLSAPRETVTEALRDQLARRKEEILSFLVTQAAESSPRPPLRPVARDGKILPSFAQQRMWFLQQLNPESVAYNLQTSVRLEGPVDVAALEWALGDVVRRHEILRTSFALADGDPVQVIAPPARVPLAVLDLRGVAAEERDREARRLRTREVRRPFDLERGPLLRTLLLNLGEDAHELLLTQHHIITDGWSIAVLIEEILALYASRRAGQPSPLPEPTLQYADFARAQRDWLQGDVLERHLVYWRKQLAALPTLELSTDRPRPPVQSDAGAVEWIELPRDLTEGLRALARREGATLFMVLLAALKTLLHRYTGQEDIAVGAPSGNRSWFETERMLGLFLNTLVLRSDLSGDPTFRELLARVKRLTLDAAAHEELPFERLVEELQPARDLSRSPLFQVLLIIQNTPLEFLASRPRAGQQLVAETGTASFDLTLYLMDTAEGLTGYLEYATALFDRSTAARIVVHLVTLLRGIVSDCDVRLSTLPLLPPSELESVVKTWNDTRAEFPPRCVHELIAAQAARTPHSVAVTCEDRSLNYGELDRRATQLARRLRRLGAGPGTLVGLCMERSVEMVVGLLGILKSGAAYTPLDPGFPAARLAYMMEDARLPLVLTESRLTDALPRTGVRRVFLDRHEALDGEPDEAPALPDATLEDLAYVIYTSGSTGRPKGVEVEHRGLANFLASMRGEPGLADSDVLLSVTTLSFDIAGLELYLPLVTGARLVLASRAVAQDGRRLSETIGASGATVLQATPATWRMLLEAGWLGQPELTMLCGGEPLPRDLSAQLLPRGRALFNLYGPTETTIWSTVEHVKAAEGAVSLGRPIANTRVYVLDARQLPVPVGVPGELYIGGEGVARGYLRRPDLTAERFVPDPFAATPGARLYRTGDSVRFRADGRLDHLGRLDQQTKVRGYRVELGEVEAALAEHPAVRASAVAAREDGSGQKRLLAYFVPHPGAISSATELRTFLRERLPDYMIPSGFVRLDALPLTPNGKLDRRALPTPEPSRPELGAIVPPRTPVEAELASLWREVLGIAELGVHDNFFELGGHSILATQMVSRLRDALGVELPLRRLFETPSVAGVAEWIETAGRAAPSALPLAPVPRDGRLLLSFAQERLWFLDHMDPGSPAYNLAGAVRLRGALNHAALERSLGEILRRHEVLRTTFVDVEGGAVQRIAAATGFSLDIRDLTGVEAGRREAEARRLAQEESLRPFDLSTGPVLRTRLLRLAPDDHVLLLVMHHIVSDAWSLGVLVRELGTLYRAFEAGEGSPLPEPKVQYVDYAAWQRLSLDGEELARQLAYWKRQLGSDLHPLRLPLDRPRPSRRGPQGAHELFALPRGLGEALKALGRREGVTFFMTLLAAFQALLHRVSGQDDIAVGSPISGRNRSEIEGLIGLFVNTLVLRTDLSGDPSFRELLKRVREVALGAYAHQDMPFEKLVSEMRPERNPSVSPLFQVMFVLQNAPLPALGLPGLAVEPLGFERGTARYDLTLFMWDGPQGQSGVLEYSTDVFEAPTVRWLLSAFVRLLEAMAANPDERVARVGLLDQAERQRLVVEWNDTATERPGATCVHELFEAQARRTPQAVAVIDGRRTLRFDELDRRANQLARHLRALGVGPEVIVGLCMERSPDLVVAVLGVLKAGGAYLPLDPDYPEERLAFLVEDAGAPLLITSTPLAGKFDASRGRLLCLDSEEGLGAESDAPLPRTADAENLAYVIYTSGSTGRPKGAMITHRGLVNYLSWATPTYVTGGDRGAPVHSSIGFDLTVTSLFCPLVAGQSVTLVADSADLAAALRAGHDFSLVKITPAHMELLAQQLTPPEAAGAARCFVIGGEALVGEALAFWRAHAPDVRLVNEYGPTETVVGCCVYELPAGPVPAGAVPIGRPIANTRLYVLDPHLEPVPVGVPGELYIGGDGVARGYWKRPEQSAERFLPDPFAKSPGARLYRTGDLVRHRPQGGLEYLGRLDHQVKIRGFRIELGEIEAVLAGHPGVEAGVVTVRELASGDRQLTAYLVFGRQQPTITELRRYLKKTLPSHMVPSSFVVLDALPLTENGKVDRGALPSLGGRGDGGEGYVAPRTPMEMFVAAVWQEALGLERVGVHDNFFDLGGHSLLSLRVLARIEERVGRRLGPRELIFQTLGQFAATCEGSARLADPSRADAFAAGAREVSP